MPALCWIIQLDTEPALWSKLLDPLFVTESSIQQIIAYGIRNPGLWNPKYSLQDFEIYGVESRI